MQISTLRAYLGYNIVHTVFCRPLCFKKITFSFIPKLVTLADNCGLHIGKSLYAQPRRHIVNQLQLASVLALGTLYSVSEEEREREKISVLTFSLAPATVVA